MRYAHLGMVALFAAACGSSSKTAELADAGGGGGIDGGDGTSNPGCTSFASLEAIDTCQLSFDDDLTITGKAQYDTDLQTLTQGNTTIPVKHKLLTVVDRGVESILIRNLTIMGNQELRIVGGLPIAILASGNVTLMSGARIDVSNGGAGATLATSPCFPGPTVGGGGGGLGAAGGDGAYSDTHGPAFRVPTKVLRGGCPGAGGSGTIYGKGGDSGGAIHLAAAGRIDLATGSAIDAGGGPGRRGTNPGATFGGGGGSGGMLMLEAPHIIGPNATITANGGGGGGGGDATTSGGDGSQGTLSATRASGGTGAVAGGRGGSSDAPTGENAAMATETSSAGGGGGVGIIRIKSADNQLGLISPAPQ